MTTFLQLLFNGVALGCVYALIALGFTAIHRASNVINFAQGAFLLLGAYLVSTAAVDHGFPFPLAVILGLVAMVVIGIVFQMLILRRVQGQPAFTVVMITIGLNIIIVALVSALFGNAERGNGVGDPWGNTGVHLGSVVLLWVKVWTIVVTAAILLGFFVFDRYTRYGLATRATAIDEEAALAAGIPVRRVNAIAWGLAGALATVAGIFLSGSPNVLDPSIGDIALLAFPAIIIGGLDSPIGAVVGGLVIGLVYELFDGYSSSVPWLGHNFYSIAPYIVMIAVLLVKPYGLFGRPPAERV
ncbi:MAG: branched-chain amino acid ABC transporter permease [Candidatus Dormibacteraeota bacterium]|uniref:Branched-chain amino acid ABC transporter permease n=1 Tax=Candidatus Amunia macphersoniae TaxID=3127014 RepID=A0A934KI90_9BACT|nr:branched-chain amino acid ABC transporter permease [Candidatus Dormibacteraeota bacterium]